MNTLITRYTLLLSIVFLIGGIRSAKAQCNTACAITSNGNGNYSFDIHNSIPAGWDGYCYLSFENAAYGYANESDSNFYQQTINFQFYANDTFVVRSVLGARDPMDSTNTCESIQTDTVIVQSYNCAVEVNPIGYYAAASTFYGSYHSGTSNSYCTWYIQDSTGSVIHQQTGLNTTSMVYNFAQNGMYTISFVVNAIDTISQTQCSDSASIVINRNVIPSCGAQTSLQQFNLGGSTVKLLGHSNMPYTSSYFRINGQIFLGDSIIYTYPSQGWQPVCFVTQNVNGGTICRDSINITIPVGNGMPGNCYASFTLTEDSLNAGSWYAVNNSTGFLINYLWDFGDGTSSTQAYPTHTYAVPGNYVICLTVSDNYGCSNSTCDSTSRITQHMSTNGIIGSLTVLAPTVGIAENHSVLAEPKVFPNPMTETSSVTFNSSLSATGKIEVVNILGATVLSENVVIVRGNNEFKLNTSSLNNGVYYVNIIAENRVLSTVKAVK